MRQFLILLLLIGIAHGLNYKCHNDQVLVVQSFGNDTIRMHCQRLDLCGYQSLKCDYDELQPQCGGRLNFVSHVNQKSATSPVEHTCCNLFNPRAPHAVPTHTGNDCFIYELPDGTTNGTKADPSPADDAPYAVLKNPAEIPEQFDGITGYRLRLFLLKNKSPPTLLVKGIERRLDGYRVTICRPRCTSYDKVNENLNTSGGNDSGEGEWRAISWSSWSSSSWSTWARHAFNKAAGGTEERVRTREGEGKPPGTTVNINVNGVERDLSGGAGAGAESGAGTGSGAGAGAGARADGVININIHTGNATGGSSVAVANANVNLNGGSGSGSSGAGAGSSGASEAVTSGAGKSGAEIGVDGASGSSEAGSSGVGSSGAGTSGARKSGAGSSGAKNGADGSSGAESGASGSDGDGKGNKSGSTSGGDGKDSASEGLKAGAGAGSGGDGTDSGAGNGNGSKASGANGSNSGADGAGVGSGSGKGTGSGSGTGAGAGSGSGSSGNSTGSSGASWKDGSDEADDDGDDNDLTDQGGLITVNIVDKNSTDSGAGASGTGSGASGASGTGSGASGASSENANGLPDPDGDSESVNSSSSSGATGAKSGASGASSSKEDTSETKTKSSGGDDDDDVDVTDEVVGTKTISENKVEELLAKLPDLSSGEIEETKTRGDRLSGGVNATLNRKSNREADTTSSDSTSSDTASDDSGSSSSSSSTTKTSLQSDSVASDSTSDGTGSGSSGMNCFSGDTLVTTVTGQKRMDELAVGDFVLVPAAGNVLKYERVEMFYHREADTRANFVVLYTKSGRRLSLTGRHLLPTAECTVMRSYIASSDGIDAAMRESRYAEKARRGECVLSVDPITGHLIADKIVRIGRKTSKGIYSPMTVEGSLVADGVLSSCFSHLESHTVHKVVFDFLFMVYDFFGMLNHDISIDRQPVPTFITFVQDLSKHIIPFS